MTTPRRRQRHDDGGGALHVTAPPPKSQGYNPYGEEEDDEASPPPRRLKDHFTNNTPFFTERMQDNSNSDHDCPTCGRYMRHKECVYCQADVVHFRMQKKKNENMREDRDYVPARIPLNKDEFRDVAPSSVTLSIQPAPLIQQPQQVMLTDSNNLVFSGTVSPGSSLHKGWGVFTHFVDRGIKMFDKRAAVYEGFYENGKFQGKGIYRDVDDYEYEGEFLNSQRHGQGKCKWPCGKVYEGEWQNDEMHGRGREVQACGNVYDGEYYGGVRNGLGVAKFAETKTAYRGYWKFGKQHGMGELRDKHGKIIQQGQWNNGIFVGHVKKKRGKK